MIIYFKNKELILEPYTHRVLNGKVLVMFFREKNFAQDEQKNFVAKRYFVFIRYHILTSKIFLKQQYPDLIQRTIDGKIKRFKFIEIQPAKHDTNFMLKIFPLNCELRAIRKHR